MKSSTLLLSAFTALAALSSVSAREADVYGTSPSRAITWSVDPATKGLYLSTDYTSAKLCDVSSPRTLRVHFSPDERYIFVTDASNIGTRVSLFKRSSGIKYSRVSGYNFDLATQRLAVQVDTGVKISSPVLTSSRYLECIGWSRNGQWAILRLNGEGSLNGRRVEVDDFKCAFNPSRGEFTNDLGVTR